MNKKRKSFRRFMAMVLTVIMSLGTTSISSIAETNTSSRAGSGNNISFESVSVERAYSLVNDTTEPHHPSDNSQLVMTETFDSMPEVGSSGSGKWAYQGVNSNQSIIGDALQLTGDTSSTAVYARYEIPSARQKNLMTANFKVKVNSLSSTTKKVSFGFMSGGTSAANEIHKLVLSDGSGLFSYRNASETAVDLSLAANGKIMLSTGEWYDFTIVAATNALALGDKTGTCDIYMGDTLVYTTTAANLSGSADVFRSFFIKIDSSSSSDLKVSIDDLSIYEGVKIPEEDGSGGDEPPPQPVTKAAVLVEVDKPIAVLSVGDTDTIIPRVTYNAEAIAEGIPKYDTAVSYRSSDESVAAVDQNGLITAMGAGLAIIRVESDLTPEVYETCKVYVDQTAPGKATLGDDTPAFVFYNERSDWAEKSNWKLQLPLVNRNESGIEIGVVEKSAEELQSEYQSEFFYLDEDNWLSFWCPVEGGKTANTSYARSELREMIDPNETRANWGWEGMHVMEVTQKVEQVPQKAANAASVKYGETIVTQIHGIEKDGSNANPLIKVRYQYNYSTNTGDLVVELKVGTDKNAGDDKPVFTNVPLGQEFTTVIKVIDNVLYCTISTVDQKDGYREKTYVHEFVDRDYRWSDLLGYFKAGNYIQDNAIDNHFGDGPTHGEGALVKIKPGSFHVYHSEEVDEVEITNLTLAQTGASVALGDTIKLIPQFTPENTTQKNFVWEVVSGSEHVLVAQDGTVLGITEGIATVKVTSTSNSSLSAVCNITVVGGMPISDGIPIYQSDFESEPIGAKLNEIGNWFLSPEVQDGAVTLQEINGIKAIRVYDNTATAGMGALLKFPDQDDTVTIQFKAMMEDIYANTAANRENGTISKMYIGVGVSANGTSLPDAEQTYRIRNNGTTLSGGVSGSQYWQPTNNGVSGYAAAQENADKADFALGEWKEITYIITPDNNSPYKNTTRVYMDGYYIGNYQNHVGTGKSDFSKLSHFRFYTGTADAMTAWIDDIKVYSGAKTPTPKNSVPIETFEIAPTPSKLGVGDTFQLTPAITPSNAVSDVIFKVVSGKTAAQVSESGVLIGLSEGTVIVEMVSKIDAGKKATCIIEVVAAMTDVSKIELLSRNIHVSMGNKYQLNPIFIPFDATEKGLKYTILSGSDVISVSNTGEILALKPGVASLQITSLNNFRATTDCTISVTKSVGPDPVLLYSESFGTDSAASLNKNASVLPYWGINLDGNTTQNTSATAKSVDSGNYALNLVDGNPGGQPTAMLKFEPTSAPVTFNFKLMIENDKRDAGNNVSAVRVSVGAGLIGSAAAQTFVLKTTGTFVGEAVTDRRYQYPVIIDDSGTIEYSDLAGISYQLNAWNSVKLVVTPGDGSVKANTTDIYINGTKVATVNNLNSQPVVDGIQFHAENESLVTYWIDDVEVWAGEYLEDIYPEKDIVTVSFNANSGSGVMTSVNAYKGENYRLPDNAYTRRGYLFSGWRISNVGDMLPVGSLITVNNDIMLYAQWIANDSSNSGGGSVSSNVKSSYSWQKDSKGWWLKYSDGTYPKNNWALVNGKWYYFDAAGYMMVGWQNINQVWYFLDPVNGDMKTGWILVNGKWYYLHASGAMAVKWIQVNEKWYYLKQDGSCAINETTPDGYKVNENGEWII